MPTEASTNRAEGSVSGSARRAVVVVAATVGAAAAATALAAPADAASKYAVWDRVAKCESTNNWDINTGNGFYGGLQFSDRTWDGYGGEKYAGRADNATRVEQIEVARRVLKSQGPNAWPVCSHKAGLTKHNGRATSATLPATAGSDRTTAAVHRKAKHRAKADTHATQSAHTAKHAKHATYTVRSGDTLARIAHSNHVAGGWKALYQANRSTLQNPNVIHVGQRLHLPG